MIYYLEVSKEKVFIIGEQSFNNFWTDQGWDLLTYVNDNYPDQLETLKIKDSTNRKYTVIEFFKMINGLKIIT